MSGVVHLVGAGPGDPDLLTVRGLRLLQEAEVVVHDRLGAEGVLHLAPPDALLIDAGKAPGRHGMTQEEISAVLVEHARAGRRVVRLKGGDPFVFGRGGEEALALAEAGLRFEVVPGVSSAIAAPALAGIPVTHRGIARTVTIASGHDDPASPAARARWEALAQVPGTVVLLMAMTNLADIAAALIGAGRAADEPAAAIQWSTTAEERRVTATLATVARACAADGLGSPAVVVIGPVVALADLLESARLATVGDDTAHDGHGDAEAGVEQHHVGGRPGVERAEVGPAQ
jgi:uroporphyrin-III C-methyltransferase